MLKTGDLGRQHGYINGDVTAGQNGVASYFPHVYQENLTPATAAARKAGLSPTDFYSNARVHETLADAEANRPPDQVVYVLVEAGLGPELQEFKLNIPAFIPGMPFVGVAFPILKKSVGAPASFAVQADGARTELAEACDFDRVVAKDFDVQLPGIIARCIASTLTKAAITCAINQAAKNSGNNWVQVGSLIGTSIYGIATNRADQRIWETLPQRGLYARIPMPQDRRLAIEGISGAPVELGEGSVVLVWVRAPQAGSPPAVRVIRLR
jgi:hypothetical protein